MTIRWSTGSGLRHRPDRPRSYDQGRAISSDIRFCRVALVPETRLLEQPQVLLARPHGVDQEFLAAVEAEHDDL